MPGRGMRSARGWWLLGAAGFVALVGPACDWRKFDDIKGRTPVLAIGAPSNFAATSEDFGRVIAPAGPPADGSRAARFVVAGAGETAIAVVTLDTAGQASSESVASAELESLPEGVAITALAAIPGTERMLLGVPEIVGFPGGHALRMDLAPPYQVTAFVANTTEPLFGAGVASDNIGGGAAPELVVLSATALHVYVDGAATDEIVHAESPACPFALSGSLPTQGRLNRAVAIGRNLLGAGGVQVVVGTPNPASPGTVSIFTVDIAARTITCSLLLTGADNLFGQSLTLGEFNNDAAPDLLVGSPPTHAVLFRGPITATPTMTITATGAVRFGASVAALPLDGMPGDEALIADPDATVNGEAFAGNVSVYSGPALATKAKPTPVTDFMSDRTPGASEFYGSVVRVLPFCGSATGAPDAGTGCVTTGLPLVGSATRAFTYYTLGTADPRQ
jgi:hypothetical protein